MWEGAAGEQPQYREVAAAAGVRRRCHTAAAAARPLNPRLTRPCLPFGDTQDYQGQLLSENLFQYIITTFSVIGFMYGYYVQLLSQAIYIIGLGVVVASLVRA